MLSFYGEKKDAVEKAFEYIKDAMKNAYGLGRGKGGKVTTAEMSLREGEALRRQSWSKRLGLQFPVARVKKTMRKFLTHEQKHVKLSAAVYLTAVLEYLIAEMLEAAGNTTRETGKRRILPRYIFLAVKKDRELDAILQNVTFAESGVEPFIHAKLLPVEVPP